MRWACSSAVIAGPRPLRDQPLDNRPAHLSARRIAVCRDFGGTPNCASGFVVHAFRPESSTPSLQKVVLYPTCFSLKPTSPDQTKLSRGRTFQCQRSCGMSSVTQRLAALPCRRGSVRPGGACGLRCCDARRKISKASSGATCSRSMRIPCACPIILARRKRCQEASDLALLLFVLDRRSDGETRERGEHDGPPAVDDAERVRV